MKPTIPAAPAAHYLSCLSRGSRGSRGSRSRGRGCGSAVAIGASGLLAVTCVTCWCARATADDANGAGSRKNVAVVTLGDGPDGQAIVSGVVAKLSPPYSEGDTQAFRGALGPAPVRSIGMEAAVKRKDRDADFVARVRAALHRAHADRAVVVHTEKVKNKEIVHLWMVDGQAAAPAGAEVDQDVHTAAGAGVDDQTGAVWSAVEGFLSGGSGPASAPAPGPALGTGPAPASEAAPGASSSSSTPGGGGGGSLGGAAASVEVSPAGAEAPSTTAPDRTRAGAFASAELDVVAGSRHFSYVDRLTGSLRPYDLFVAPALRIAADVYPLSKTRLPVVGGLGLAGEYSHAFALSSQDQTGASVGTSWQTFDIGVRDRIAIGPSVVVGVGGGFGDTTFSFDGAVTPTEVLPSVDYKYLRAGADGRYALGELSIRGGFGYRGVLSAGDYGKLFPHASVGGVDASLGIARALGTGLEISVDLEYARYFYSLLPKPGDAYVAGGALDEMASLSLGLAYLL